GPRGRGGGGGPVGGGAGQPEQLKFLGLPLASPGGARGTMTTMTKTTRGDIVILSTLPGNEGHHRRRQNDTRRMTTAWDDEEGRGRDDNDDNGSYLTGGGQEGRRVFGGVGDAQGGSVVLAVVVVVVVRHTKPPTKRTANGYDRPRVYSDGNIEDLGMADLVRLAKLDPGIGIGVVVPSKKPRLSIKLNTKQREGRPPPATVVNDAMAYDVLSRLRAVDDLVAYDADGRHRGMEEAHAIARTRREEARKALAENTCSALGELPKITSILEETLRQWYIENNPDGGGGQAMVNSDLGHSMYQGSPYLQTIQWQEEEWRTRKERSEEERHRERREERMHRRLPTPHLVIMPTQSALGRSGRILRSKPTPLLPHLLLLRAFDHDPHRRIAAMATMCHGAETEGGADRAKKASGGRG
ncbi:hypothetical protein ACHAW5_005750, partial [Stephanodiscus triporus]